MSYTNTTYSHHTSQILRLKKEQNGLLVDATMYLVTSFFVTNLFNRGAWRSVPVRAIESTKKVEVVDGFEVFFLALNHTPTCGEVRKELGRIFQRCNFNISQKVLESNISFRNIWGPLLQKSDQWSWRSMMIQLFLLTGWKSLYHCTTETCFSMFLLWTKTLSPLRGVSSTGEVRAWSSKRSIEWYYGINSSTKIQVTCRYPVVHKCRRLIHIIFINTYYDTIINIVMQVNKKKVSVHLPLAVVQPRQTSNPDVYAVGKSNLGTWCFL